MRLSGWMRGGMIAALVGSFVLIGAAQASANSIRLSGDGGSTWTTVHDTDGDGIVLFSGSVGAFTVNLTTGLSMPNIGSATSPMLELTSIEASSSAGGTLLIQHSAIDFTKVGSALAGFTILAQTGGATVNYYNTYWDAGNGLFTTTSLMTDQGPFLPPLLPVFPQFEAGAGPTSAGYSLTQTLSITHAGTGDPLVQERSSLRAELAIVPDGGSTLGFLGLALLVAGVVGRKLQN